MRGASSGSVGVVLGPLPCPVLFPVCALQAVSAFMCTVFKWRMGPNVVSPLLRSVCVSTCIVLMLGMMLGNRLRSFVTCVPRAG